MMPKNYTCPCGTMEVTFEGLRVRIRGGFLFGSLGVHAYCMNLRGTLKPEFGKCPGKKRIGYDIEFVDKKGIVRQGSQIMDNHYRERAQSDRPPRSTVPPDVLHKKESPKKRKPKKNKDQIEWSFD